MPLIEIGKTKEEWVLGWREVWELSFGPVGFPGGAMMKNTCLSMQETHEMQVQSLGWADLLEEEMALPTPIFLPRESYVANPDLHADHQLPGSLGNIVPTGLISRQESEEGVWGKPTTHLP